MSSNEKLPAPTFALPSPVFKTPQSPTNTPHFLSPNGIQQLSRNDQPPPMYGPRGSTIPPKHFAEYGKTDQAKPPKEYCDACDWEFNSLGALRSHQSEHEECAVEGCDFRAHPKIVDKHIEMSHQSGMFDQIKKLDNPEEIAKWREARKKKYPTMKNVLLRQQMQQEKQKRGEKLEPRNNRFGRSNERTTNVVKRTGNGSEFSKSFEKKARFSGNEKKDVKMESISKDKEVKSTEPKKNKTEEKKTEVRDESLWNDGIPMFTGTSKWKDYNRVQVKARTTALTGLLGSYGTDTDEEEEIERDIEVPSSQIDKVPKDLPEEVIALFDSKKQNDRRPPLLTISGVLAGVKNGVIEKPEEQETNSIEEERMSEDESPPDESPIARKPLLTISGALSGTNILPDSEKDNQETSEKTSDDNIFSKPNAIPDQKPSTSKKQRKKLSGLEANMGLLLKKTRKQNTMLEKLLETQIIHERNVLLQCVRHVVANNFFQDNKTNDL